MLESGIVERTSNDKWNALKALSIAAIPVVLAVGGWYIQRQLQNQTLSRDYVQLAVSILKEPDSAAQTNPVLRAWAVDLLRENSPTRLSDQLVEQLKTGRATLPAPPANQPKPFLLEMVSMSTADGHIGVSVERAILPSGSPIYSLIYSFNSQTFRVTVGDDPRVKKLVGSGFNEAQSEILVTISKKIKSQENNPQLEEEIRKLIASILDKVQP